jgi:hypothetical protein
MMDNALMPQNPLIQSYKSDIRVVVTVEIITSELNKKRKRDLFPSLKLWHVVGREAQKAFLLYSLETLT